ncbi:MAG: hypothetical protein ACLGIF_02570, partial [Actinomycetes bacterium]
MTGATRERVPPGPPAGQRRPDVSMDLLNDIMRQPIDPDYARAAARGPRQPGRRWALTGVALAIGALFTVAALQTTRAAPTLESERSELINQVQAAEAEQDRLREQLTTLDSDIDRLRAAASGGDATARRLERQI